MSESLRTSQASSADDETREMVLLTIVRAEENARVLSRVELARELRVSRPALEIQLDALLHQGMISISQTGTCSLTDCGRESALALLRRHRLTERLFTDMLRLDWARAHEEADKFEHAVSPEAESELAAHLGDPDTCPHGNPIPKARGDTPTPATFPLTGCKPPTRVRICRIGQETAAALQHLATLGLLPNVEIEIENKAPFDGPILVRIGRAHYALGHDLAKRIWVTAAG